MVSKISPIDKSSRSKRIINASSRGTVDGKAKKKSNETLEGSRRNRNKSTRASVNAELTKKGKKVKKKKKNKTAKKDSQRDEFNEAEVIKSAPLNDDSEQASQKEKEKDNRKIRVMTQPSDYLRCVLDEERPDLVRNVDEKFSNEELAALEKYLVQRAGLNRNDLFYVDHNHAVNPDEEKYVRYRVMLRQDEGRFSSIYMVYKENKPGVNNETPYILKTILRCGSERSALFLKREKRVMKQLNESKAKFVSTLLESGQVGDRPYIVMNCLGENLHALVERLTLKQPSIFYIAVATFVAIRSLHALNFVHRDIKLANFCLGAPPNQKRIFLIDFGDAVHLGQDIKMGTPDAASSLYMSIEAHKSRKTSVPKMDVESWFFMILDIFSPEKLKWRRESDLNKVMDMKVDFWKEPMSEIAPTDLKTLAELVERMPTWLKPRDYQAVEQQLNSISKREFAGLKLDWER